MKKKPTGIGISNVFIKMLNGDYLDKIPSYDGWKKTSESRRRGLRVWNGWMGWSLWVSRSGKLVVGYV